MNVVEARLRPATQEEVAQEKGGYLWRSINSPWNFAMKFLGTWELYSMKGNFLVMNTPRPLRLAHAIKYYTGYAPERSFMRSLPSFIATWNIIEDQTKVVEEFFRHDRDGDIFEHSGTMLALAEIIKKAFPEAAIQNEDFIFTCSPEKNKMLHDIILRLITGQKLRSAAGVIKNEAEQTLKAWEGRCAKGDLVNATVESRSYASRIISRLIFGTPTGDDNIAIAVNFINFYIIKTMMRTVTADDTPKFNEALKVFNNTVTGVLESSANIPLFEEGNLTHQQKLAMVFTIFFAGQETVGTLLSYILWKLAKDGDLQKKLREECLKGLANENENERIKAIQDLFVRTIGEFPPAYGITRLFKGDTCLEFRFEGETEARKHIFYKGERLSVMMNKLAEKNLPMVDSNQPSYGSWLPFGSGKHHCPGETLAKTEIYEFLVAILSKYEIFTEQVDEIKKVGAVTLQLAEDVIISLKPLKDSEHIKYSYHGLHKSSI